MQSTSSAPLGDHDRQAVEFGNLVGEFLVPVSVEVLGEKADQFGVAVAEGCVAAIGDVVDVEELVRHQRQWLVEQLGAAGRALVEPHLEGTDAIEPGTVPADVELVDADGVADLGHGDQAGANVAIAELERGGLTAGSSSSPGAGKAVGLLLGDDSGKIAVEAAETELDGVGVLVGDHGADRGGSVGPGEFDEEAVVAIVVHHEVALTAVEGNVLGNVVVGGARRPAAGNVVGSARVGREDAAGQRLEPGAVDGQVLLGPPDLEVGDHRLEEAVVVCAAVCRRRNRSFRGRRCRRSVGRPRVHRP